MGKELAVIEPGASSSFLALRTTATDLAELIQENLGGDGIGVHELDKVKVPSGGGTMWEVPTLDGIEGAKTIEGVILERLTRRAYWETRYGEGEAGVAPDCKSDDGIYGEGDPGGACASCALNEFGTSTKQDGSAGHGKACQEFRLVFMLTPDSLIPIVIKVPASSLAPFKSYSLRLLRAQLTPLHVVTKLGLVKSASKDGIAYSRVTFEAGDRLSPEAVSAMKSYQELLKPVAAQVTVDRDDVPSGE